MPDTATMIPIGKLRGRAVRELAQEARQFLKSFEWCKRIVRGYLAWAVAPCVGVFFFRLVPARTVVDRELWIVVGDLPPAYLVCDDAQTFQEALDCYGTEMMEWVKAGRKRRSLKKVIPVNAPPTPEYANMLESRIKFIRKHFVDVSPEMLPRGSR